MIEVIFLILLLNLYIMSLVIINIYNLNIVINHALQSSILDLKRIKVGSRLLNFCLINRLSSNIYNLIQVMLLYKKELQYKEFLSDEKEIHEQELVQIGNSSSYISSYCHFELKKLFSKLSNGFSFLGFPCVVINDEFNQNIFITQRRYSHLIKRIASLSINSDNISYSISNDQIKYCLKSEGITEIYSAKIQTKKEAYLYFFAKNSNNLGGYINRIIKSFAKEISVIFSLLEDLFATESKVSIRDEALANLTHDIRGPINNIFLGLDVISSEVNSKEIISGVKNNVQKLSSLVDRLLSYARVESLNVSLNTKNFVLSNVVELVVKRYVLAANSKNLNIEFCNQIGKVECSIDPDHIDCILDNLISNAIKYTECGLIKVVLREGCENIEILVKDTGRGIDSASRDLMFEPFVRCDNDAVDNGLGLGLCIVKRLVDLNSLSIVVYSEINKGSTFIIKGIKKYN